MLLVEGEEEDCTQLALMQLYSQISGYIWVESGREICGVARYRYAFLSRPHLAGVRAFAGACVVDRPTRRRVE